MKKSFDVVGFGALNLDRLYRVEKIAERGGHERILDAFESPGGSAANTIAGLARLGLKTGFVGVVGDDPEGRIILSDFVKRKVDVGGIKVLRGRSGVIIGFIDRCGERTLYPYPGVNDLLEKRDVCLGYINKAAILHMTSFAGEKQFILQKEIIKNIKNTRISFSPGDLYTRKGLYTLMPLIEKTSFLFLNESEIRQLTGEEYVGGVEKLLGFGVEVVAVTLGGRGCYVADKRNSCLVPAKKTKVVDTTGAGDAFAAGFLYTIICGGDIRLAGMNGNRAASICIREVGARTSLASKKDLRLVS